MQTRLDVMGGRGVAYGLLAAAVAFPATLLTAALGQALGAVVGGCSWIGIATPIHEPTWALVNQPTLHFSSLPSATGYWWGSWLAPAFMAVGGLSLLPRARTVAAELLLVHAAWAATVVGLAWLPLLDPVDGHIGRWLGLHQLPGAVLYVVPIAAAPAAFLVSMRLLALLRIARQHTGRGLRLAAVATHLVAPAAVWIVTASLLRGTPLPLPSAAAALPMVVVLVVAWRSYPPAFAHRLAELETTSYVRLLVALVLVAGTVWLAGRPLADGRTAGILWAGTGLYNNVRPWIEPTPVLPGARQPAPTPGAAPDASPL